MKSWQETHPEGVTEAVVWQDNSNVFLLCAHSHHQNTCWADKGFKPSSSRSEEARIQGNIKCLYLWSPLSIKAGWLLFPFLHTCKAASACLYWLGPAGPGQEKTKRWSWRQFRASAAPLGLKCRPYWATDQSTAWRSQAPASAPSPGGLSGLDQHTGGLGWTLTVEGAGEIPTAPWHLKTASLESQLTQRGSRHKLCVAVHAALERLKLAWPWRRWRRSHESGGWGRWGGGASQL